MSKLYALSADTASAQARWAMLDLVEAALTAPAGQASALFAQSLAVHGADQWPFELARVRLAFGEYLRRTRATGEARTQLRAALDGFLALGELPWAERAAAELRATSPTRVRKDYAAAPRLTPQELRIASLAATGLTNKEIGQRLYLSPRTVSGHLYRIFPKLGISRRAALRDALNTMTPVREARLRPAA